MNIYGATNSTATTATSAGTRRAAEPSVSFSEVLQAHSTPAAKHVSSAAISNGANWQQIADNYDVSNISTRERGALTGALLENDLISSAEGLALAAPYSMNENLDTRRDYRAISHEALEFSRQNGVSPEQLAVQEGLVSILDRLFALSGSNA